MSAFLFPGQGSQIVGMGLEFYNSFEIVKKIFKEADDKLQFPISKMILEGPEDKLKLTENTQPAILTVSYSIFKVMKEEFQLETNKIKFFAGHSLGEYSALVCAESLTFLDALYLLHERGKSMQEAVPIGQGGMIAVMGTTINELTSLIKNENITNGVCEVANDNSEGQVILSGNKKSIEKFQTILKSKKIKSIPLKVSAPFHCSLMKPAAKNMEEKINKTNFKKPSHDIVVNVSALPEKDPVQIKKNLVEQIYSTVKWRETINFISEAGVVNFIEVGPGRVLTGMVKRTKKNANCFSINSIADIKNLINELKK
tara:strand:- start:32 stop:973 length:942 start_codon:yes stop_codon:yes gene_type:complete